MTIRISCGACASCRDRIIGWWLRTFLFVASFAVTQGLTLAQWKPLATGGGGWMTGLDVHPSGTPVFARSDVGSAYRWDETTRRWTNIVNAQTLPSDDVHWSRHSGVLSLVSAPSDKNVAYLAYDDTIYRSGDAGDHWVRTSFPSQPMTCNDDRSKLTGERLSVDPANPDIVYFGSINDGLWHTNDGGKRWNRVTAIPKGAKDRGIRQVLFDPASQRDGKTSRIYAVVDGEGVFVSSDSGKTWRNTELDVDAPKFLDAEISRQGELFVCGKDGSGRTFGVMRYTADNWQNVFEAEGHAIGEIALDPLVAGRAVLMTAGFNQTFLTRNLQSDDPQWKLLPYQRKATEIPWLEWTEGNWFSLGEVVFDPQVRDRLWIAEGTGVWRTSTLLGDTVVWEDCTVGQEHLVSNDIVALPAGRSLTAHWDRPLFLHEATDAFPAVHLPSRRFNSAWSLDRCPADPNFIVAIIEDHRYCCYDDGHRNSGYSTDGGQTWTAFQSFPTFRGRESVHGQIAVSANDPSNIVWLPTWNSMPYYTKDRGETWTKSILPGHSEGCGIAAPWFQRECLVADRVKPATFYLYDWSGGHLFHSADGGKSWSRIENVLPKWGYHAKLRSVDGKGGHLWFAPGPQQSVKAIGGLMHSTDGGASWSTCENTTEVLNVCVGKAAPNSEDPTVFMQGRVDGEFGYFRSIDRGTTWSKLGDYPLGIYDSAKVMQADPWIYDRLYVGFSGNGFVCYDGTVDSPK